MSDETLISYAQNAEDVVLWRALHDVEVGRYVDVGACDPVDLSVTKALYDRGWRGVDIDAIPDYVKRLSEARPGNEVVQAAITDEPVTEIVFHQLVDTGLSTLDSDIAAEHEVAGFEHHEIVVPARTLDAVCENSNLLDHDLHLLKVDVEGAEGAVLRSFDLQRWRPWVVVVEATRPLTSAPSFADWDPYLVDAGYRFMLFDGISRFYLSPDHPELEPALSYPACTLDDFVPYRQHVQDVRVDVLTADLDTARADAVRWRNEAVGYWANAMTRVQSSEDEARVLRAESARITTQLTKLRTTLTRVRAERDKLRTRVARQAKRIDSLTARLDTAREADATPARPHRQRLRTIARRVNRA